MWLIPFERVTLVSSAPPDETARRLQALVTRAGMFAGPFIRDGRPFIGAVKGMEFKVMRKLPPLFHNSFQPVIVGAVRPAPQGSALHLVFRPHWLVAVFFAVFLAVALVFSVVAVFDVQGGWPLPLAPLLPWAFGVALFRWELRTAVRLLAPIGAPAARAPAPLVR